MSIDLRLGDCLEIMRGMDAGSVDAVITDPPYGVNIAEWDKTIPPKEVLQECLRVSRGLVLWFGGAHTNSIAQFINLEPIPDRVLVWHVTFSLSGARTNGIFYKWHPIYCWRLPKKHNGISRDVLECATAKKNGYDHPAKKPEKLMEQIIAGFTNEGDTILDCFMGSGTTIAEALKLGRNAIGIEKAQEHFDTAQRRIAEAQAQLTLNFTEATA